MSFLMPVPVRRLCALSAFIMLGSFVPVTNLALAQDNTVIDEIVAIVEGEIILRSEVDALSLSLMQQQQAPFSEELWGQVLKEMIDQKVILVHARQDTTLQITDEQVNEEIDLRVARLAAQAGGEQRLEELYGKSVLQIKDDLRDGVRDQIMTQQYQAQKFRNVRVTPSEVEAWFHQFPTDSLPDLPEVVRVAHIVKFPEIDPAARQEAMDLISTIRDSVLNSPAEIEDFASFSDDPGSARSGGRYENIRISELVSEFGAVASTLQPGQISQVFETPFGLHFMRLNNRVGDVIDFNHILIKLDDTKVNPESALEELTTLRDSIAAFQIPFELMAKRHSDDASTSSLGGYVVDPRSQERDLVLDALGPAWRATLDTIEIGEVSEPKETELLDGRKALHIVLLQKRTPAHQVSLETDYERIEQLASQEKRARLRTEWLESLRVGLYIQILDDAATSTTNAFLN